MGSLFGLLGFALGSLFGPVGAAIGFIGGSILGGLLFPADPIKQVGPRIEDTGVTTSTYGRGIPLIYGTHRIGGNIIWASPLIERRIKREETIDGTGIFGTNIGAQEIEIIEFEYYRSFAIVFANTLAEDLIRIWADSELIYDKSGTSDVVKVKKLKFNFYKGDETQTADPVIQEEWGTRTPGFRGLCYIVFDELFLKPFGNRLPQIRAEINFASSGLQQQVEQIAVSNATDFDDFWIDGKRRRLIGFNDATNTVASVNLRDNTVTAEITDSNFHVEEIFQTATYDLEGNFFISAASGGRVFTKKFDPVSLGLIASGTDVTNLTLPGSIAIGEFPQHFISMCCKEEQTSITKKCCGPENFQGLQYPKSCCCPITQDCYDYRGLIAGLVGACHGWMRILLQHNNNASFPALYFYWGNLLNTPMIPMGNCGFLPTCGLSSYENIDVSTLGTGGYRQWLQPEVGSFFVGVKAIGGGPSKMAFVSPFACCGCTCCEGVNAAIATANIDVDGAMFFLYNRATNEYVVWSDGTGELVWLDAGDLSVNGRLGPPDIATTRDIRHSMWNYQQTGNLLVGNGDDVYLVDLNARRVIEHIPVTDFAAGNIGTDWVYDSLSDSIIVSNADGLRRYYLGIKARQSDTLDTVVSDICQRAQLDVSEIDVTELAQFNVDGYAIGRQMPARDALTDLALAYDFEIVESDFVLKFVALKDKTAADDTAVAADMAAGEDRPADVLVEETVVQEQELPERFDIRYVDPDTDYEVNVQEVKRNFFFDAVTTRQNQTVETALVMTATQARQLAERLMYREWVERRGFKGTLPPKFTLLDPADVLTISTETDDSVTEAVRLTKLTLGGNSLLEFEAVLHDAEAFTTTVEGDIPLSLGSPVIQNAIEPELCLFDLPLLREHERDGFAGVYYALLPQTHVGTWAGARLLSSNDNATFTEIGVAARAGTWGTAINALAAPTAYTTWDRDSSLTVALNYPDPSTGTVLESKTELEVLNGANVALLGNELIQYANVSFDAGTNQYTLTTLLRGRKGTEYAVSGHAIGDKFVIPDTSVLKRARMGAPSDIGGIKFFKAVAFGQEPADVSSTTYVIAGADLKPLANVDVQAFRRDSLDPNPSNDVFLIWERRTRIQPDLNWDEGAMQNPINLDVPSEEYQVDLIESGGTTASTTYTVTATISVDSWTDDNSFSDISASLPGSGVLRFSSSAADIDNSRMTVGRIGVPKGFRSMWNRTPAEIKDLTTAKTMDVYNQYGVDETHPGDNSQWVASFSTQLVIPQADMVAAGYANAPDDPIKVRIYQMNGTVRGFVKEVTV